MTDLPRLDRGALDDITALCHRSIDRPPSADELDVALFGADQPAIVRGDPRVAVVATVSGDHGAHVRLLVVDPNERKRGLGHALVRAAEADGRDLGHSSMTTGADAPFYLWPGVP